MRIDGAVAMVTGAASGLGAATAALLLSKGARVVGFDVQPHRLDAADDRALAVSGSVTSEAEVGAAIEAARTRFGRLDILVGCAGIGVSGPTLDWKGAMPLATFARAVEVNLVGTFNCLRLAAQAMSTNPPGADGERGVIVNTASAAAFEGQAGQAAYAASKAGIVGMTLPIARDLSAAGIRVVTVAPGLFETPMLAGLPPAVRNQLVRQALFPARVGRPEEFAAMVGQLIENAMINGTTVRLDGGVRLPPR